MTKTSSFVNPKKYKNAEKPSVLYLFEHGSTLSRQVYSIKEARHFFMINKEYV